MANLNPKFDEYIAKSQDFAKPILIHLREVVHRAHPDIEETIKWGFPNYDYKGIVCNMAAFKEHCSFGFWKASLLNDPQKLLKSGEGGMGDFEKIKTLADLPKDEILIDFIQQAIALNEKGISVPKPKVEKNKTIELPNDLMEKIQLSEAALIVVEKASYSFKKEYTDWINEAKSDETRNKRIETAVEWISEGKSRNWKYERK